MATLHRARSLGCNDTARSRHWRSRRSFTWIAYTLTATCLAACGNPAGNGPAEGTASPDGGPVDPTSGVPTSAASQTTAVAPSDMQNDVSAAQSSKPSPSSTSNATTTPNTPSDGAATKSADTVSVDDLPPPSPEIFDPGGSAIPPGSGPLGVETTCDGVDDDANGVVDDVDATSDGVCDCLKVATLGLHGEWGSGDFVTGWLKDHVTAAATDLDGEPLSAERLEPFHVLLIRDVSVNHNANLSFTTQEVNALWTWVRNGGGLMTVIGYSDPNESGNVNTLLQPFALSYGSDKVVQGMGASVPVSEWFDHPLSQGITEVGADNGYPVVGQGLTFAGQDDYDIGKALTIGDGHVLVWGDEWITYEDEWSSDTTYQVEQFWKNALRWLTRSTQCQVNPQ